MSYRVEYEGNERWNMEKEHGGFRRLLLTMLFLALFVAGVSAYWDEGREVLIQLLLPGDAAATWNSLEAFAQNLNRGIPLEFAAREFCLEVMGCAY